MNRALRRNWKRIEGSELDQYEDDEVVFVNKHTGQTISVWYDQTGTHREWEGEGWIVCLPSGWLCQHYNRERSAFDFARNWMRQHPAGGRSATERLDQEDEDLPLKSPLESGEMSEVAQKQKQYVSENGVVL